MTSMITVDLAVVVESFLDISRLTLNTVKKVKLDLL
jgi:hypothetical protein